MTLLKHLFAVLILVLTLSALAGCAGSERSAGKSGGTVGPASSTLKDSSEPAVNTGTAAGDSAASTNAGTNGSAVSTNGSTAANQESLEAIIKGRSAEALSAIKSMDMDKLSRMIHPDKGVRISPYGHVNTDTDIVFSAEQLKDQPKNKKEYSWGSYQGSGEPIELTFEDYYKKFIYDKDFINAKEIGYNKILGKDSKINNSFEVYPGSVIIEYHFPGFDSQYQGMDWESLRLVFEKKDTTWYISGIIHDQWTP